MKMKQRGEQKRISREEIERMRELREQRFSTYHIAQLLGRAQGAVSYHTRREKEAVEFFTYSETDYLKLFIG